jgi:hypothetical protein
MVEIKLYGSPERRPWLAQLTGLEVTEDGKTRFARNFKSGTNVSRRFGATDEYVGSIHSDGVFEAYEATCRYFLVVCGTRKIILWNKDIFPDNWSDYMRENNYSYENVWEHAWGALCDSYERLQEKMKSLN